MTSYAGIGARETPLAICSQMEMIAALLGAKGWTLRSGQGKRKINQAPDTDSADLAFERGCDSVKGRKVIRVPSLGGSNLWPDHAARYHPNWDACNDYAKHAHARNSAVMLGDYLNDPVKFVACYTPNGAIVGGTGQALRIAADPQYNIPVFNLFFPEHFATLFDWIGKL